MRPSLKIERGKSLASLSTFGIGGPAERFCVVRTIEEMQEVMRQFGRERLFFLGKGSNCLFDDKGFGGMVVLNKIDFLQEWRAGAGFSFALLGVRSARAGLAGLEFASGIPGSVGGAVVMNAGAGGQETADVLASVEVVDRAGELQVLPRAQIKFSYRTSPFQDGEQAVVAATFDLEPCEKARGRQIEQIGRRKASQPLWEKSAGCMFRNPEGTSAGKLIEQCGLKGMGVGGAAVSDLHANFIVNRGQARAQDVRELIDSIKEKVQAETGYELREEVRYVPS